MRAWRGVARRFFTAVAVVVVVSPVGMEVAFNTPVFSLGCMAWRWPGWVGLDPLWITSPRGSAGPAGLGSAWISIGSGWMGWVSCNAWNGGQVQVDKIVHVHVYRRPLLLQVHMLLSLGATLQYSDNQGGSFKLNAQAYRPNLFILLTRHYYSVTRKQIHCPYLRPTTHPRAVRIPIFYAAYFPFQSTHSLPFLASRRAVRRPPFHYPTSITHSRLSPTRLNHQPTNQLNPHVRHTPSARQCGSTRRG
ncbi:uncharacterized protein IWZ02DRAFT_182251 [Phyllosticta citriasiana]|uniref:Secreted protein n=1 Tax=Phyllosticta citriasiana TaxID=595635 RepID=A0ABR1KLZ2_9PEZI